MFLSLNQGDAYASVTCWMLSVKFLLGAKRQQLPRLMNEAGQALKVAHRPGSRGHG